jgi:hypothetical protein
MMNLLRFLSQKQPPFRGNPAFLLHWASDSYRTARYILTLLILLTISLSGAAQDYRVTGKVKDASTGDPLPGVNVVMDKKRTGTVTDPMGNFSLEVREGEHTIVFSFIGYVRQVQNIQVTGNLQLSISMERDRINLKEVTVSAEMANRNVERAEMGTVTLDIENIRNLPAFLGEVDVLRTIQLLPGVQSAGDGNTGFFVRGGNADQNLVLLDDAVVYNASHLFNFFSVFNADALNDVKLYKGGIHPSYGGRLSSVLDIRMKDGNTEQYNVNGGIGLISSRLAVDGPIQAGRSAFMVSGRRTYADMFLLLSEDEVQRKTRLYFYDLNSRMNYVINSRNRIYLSGYYGKDVTRLSELFSFDWGNATGSIRWNSILTDKLFADFALLYSNYQFNISGDIGPASFRWNSMLNSTNLKADFRYEWNDRNNLSFGIQGILHNLNPGNIVASIEGATLNDLTLSPSNGLETGIYINNEQSLPGNNLIISYGLRFSQYQVMGPGNQYIFDRRNPLMWQVSDTVSLAAGMFYQSFPSLEPRVSFRYRFNDRSSVKGSYHRMTQYIQQAQSAQSVAPYDVWFAASNNIPAQTSDQVALGYFRNFSDNRFETSVEVYYKDMKNISDIVDNGDILGNEFLEGQLRTGHGYAYGIELLVQKNRGPLTGFVGYTLATARRQIDGINENKPYFAPNDRLHDVSLSSSYSLSSTWSFGVNFIYATGTAFTMPVGKLNYQGSIAPIYGERNAGRLPDYHRLDISFTWNPGAGRPNRRFSSSWNFSFFNVYARVNPISVSFAEKEENPGIPNTSFFYIPGPIPAITWNFNF